MTWPVSLLHVLRPVSPDAWFVPWRATSPDEPHGTPLRPRTIPAPNDRRWVTKSSTMQAPSSRPRRLAGLAGPVASQASPVPSPRRPRRSRRLAGLAGPVASQASPVPSPRRPRRSRRLADLAGPVASQASSVSSAVVSPASLMAR